jgi:hypothetical protein
MAELAKKNVETKDIKNNSNKSSIIEKGLINMINPCYNIREFVGAECLSKIVKKFKLSNAVSKNIEEFIGVDLSTKDYGIIKKNRILFASLVGGLWLFQLIQATLELFPFPLKLSNLDFGAHLLLMACSYSLYFIFKAKFVFAYKPVETKEEGKKTVKFTKEEISFKNILMGTELNESKNLILGFDENKKLYVTNIIKNYHMIVAGSTGYGKSNFAHVWASCLIKSEVDAAFLLLDPKKSELKRYRDIKRVFYTGENDKIIKVLKCAENEMDRRNKLIDPEKYVNNLETWNKKYHNNKWHYIFIYMEEIADLMLGEHSYEFTKLITRLAQLGRSTGIRLVLSTQYPKAEVISAIIKINCVERVGFAVNTPQESGVIIDSPILKTLEKQGETYMRINRKLSSIKVPYLEDKDIEKVVEYLEKNHDKNGQYDMSEKFVSFVSNEINSDVEMCHDENKNRVATHLEKIEILSSEDLLKFYENNCNDEVFSLNETSNYVNIGRTKIQEFRKQLVSEGKLISTGNKLFLSKKVNLEK